MQEFHVPPIVAPDFQMNVSDLLVTRVAETPDRILFSRPHNGGWRNVSASEFQADVIALAKGFVAAGIQPGDMIGFMCTTRYEWSVVDFAAWFAGALLVPIYETSSPSQVQWILEDSGAVAVLVETHDHFSRFDEVHAELPNIRVVWQLALGDLDKLVDSGAHVLDEEVERRRVLARGADVATLLYTSGTTGRPKGCVLTHSNFVELSRNAAIALKDVLSDPGASTLLFITSAHVFARFIGVVSVYAGVRTGHEADPKRLLASVKTFKPTFLLAVPRVFEKIFNAAEQRAQASGRGAIFRKAADAAVAHSLACESGRVPTGLKIRFRVYDALIYRKLRAALGGKVHYAVSGSAPLSPYLGHFFRSLGISVLEGYGLTETTAPATANRVEDSRIGTVGSPLPGVSIRVADDGEISLSGLSVFKEYWNNPAATADAFDGTWFATGDIGSIDADGFLTITGRKKEIIVTAGGKNVAPAPLEDAIRSHPLVSQVIVIGDKKPFIAALITLDSDMLPQWLRSRGEDPTVTGARAAVNATVLAELRNAVDKANKQVSRAESIRKFVVLESELTENAGQLTPKQTVKRHVVLKDFEDTINSLYENAISSPYETDSIRTNR